MSKWEQPIFILQHISQKISENFLIKLYARNSKNENDLFAANFASIAPGTFYLLFWSSYLYPKVLWLSNFLWKILFFRVKQFLYKIYVFMIFLYFCFREKLFKTNIILWKYDTVLPLVVHTSHPFPRFYPVWKTFLWFIYIYILADLGALRAPLLARTPDRWSRTNPNFARTQTSNKPKVRTNLNFEQTQSSNKSKLRTNPNFE